MATENKKYHDYSVVLQPTPPWRAKLTDDQQKVFKSYGYTF